MADHPFLGVVLFAIGALIVAAAYYTSNAQSILLGHIIAFNGVLLVALGVQQIAVRKEHDHAQLHQTAI